MLYLKYFIILIAILINSCSTKEEETKSAVLVFKKSQELEVNPDLSKEKTLLPKQKHNKLWFGGNRAAIEGYDIENFKFPKKITKKESIFIDYNFTDYDKSFNKPLIVDNKIYLLSEDGILIAKDSKYNTLWKKTILKKKDKKDFRGGKIFYNDGKIFATSGFNYIVAIDAWDGKILWSKKISSIPVSTPIVIDNELFVITQNNQTYALNSSSGQIKWIHQAINKNTTILGSSNPVFYNNYIISSYSSGEIYFLDKTNGEVIWSLDLNINLAINSDFILNDIDSTPIIKDDVLYVIGNGGLMSAISLKNNGVFMWQKKISSIIDFWIAQNYIYLIDNNNNLMSIQTKDGDIKWINNLKNKNIINNKKIIYNGILMAGDKVVLSTSKNILFFKPDDGELINKINFSGFANDMPIVANKKIYLSKKGFLLNRLLIFN